MSELCSGCLESRQGGRIENQDRVDFCRADVGTLVIVCDGMGGGPGGATASSTAIRSIIDYVKQVKPGEKTKEQILVSAIKQANKDLISLEKADRSLQGMGSTCVCLLVDEQSAMAAQVGDSRIYQMRYGKKIWRTWDHSMVMDKVKEKHHGLTEGKEVDIDVENARQSPHSNVITRALGITEEVEVETHELAFEKGDWFALCTDGVWGAMPEPELLKCLSHGKDARARLFWTFDRVEEIGLSNGNHHDNYTLALVEVTKDSILKTKMNRESRTLIMALAAVAAIALVAVIVFATMWQCSKNDSELAGKQLDKQNEYIEQLQKSQEKLSEQCDSLSNKVKENQAKIETKADLKADLKSSLRESEKNNAEQAKAVQTEANSDKSSKDNTQASQETETSKEKVIESIDNVVKALEDAKTWCKENPRSKLSSIHDNAMKEAVTALEKTAKGTQFQATIDDVCSYLKDQLNSPVAKNKETEGAKREGHYKELIRKARETKNNIQKQ